MFRNYIKKIILYLNDLTPDQKKNIDNLQTIDDIIRKNDKINTYILINSMSQKGGNRVIDEIVKTHKDLITKVKNMNNSSATGSSTANADVIKALKTIKKLKFLLVMLDSSVSSEKIKILQQQIAEMETTFSDRLKKL
jgi:hypothetical protein